MHKFVELEKRIFYVILFLILLLSALIATVVSAMWEQEQKFTSQQYRLTDSEMHKKLQHHIDEQKEATLAIALSASKMILFERGGRIDVTRSQKAMDDLVTSLREASHYKNVRIRLVDGNRHVLCSSCVEDDKTLLELRNELKDLNNEPRIMQTIEVDRSTLTFNVVVPLYDGERFAGLLEITTLFDSFVEYIKRSDEEVVVLIAQRHFDRLKQPNSSYFINGFNVVNADANTPALLRKIEQRGVESFIDASIYLRVGDSMVNINDLQTQAVSEGPGYLLFDEYLLVQKALKSYDHTDAAYLLFFKKRSSVDLHGFAASQELLVKLQYLLALLLLLLIFAAVLRLLFIKRIRQYTLFNFGTKLPNKTRLMEQLDYYERIGKPCMLMVLNIDNFSNLNIIYGFEAGDQILYSTARRLEKLCHRAMVFHLEADEFAVLFTDGESPLPQIKAVQRHFYESPITYGSFSINLAFCYGVAVDDEHIYRNAVFALKQAKRLGSNRYHIYDPERDRLDQQVRQDLVEKSRILYDAVKNDRIMPFFQGIRNNTTGEMTKFETLARVIYDSKPLPLVQFEEAARATGMLPQITKVIIDKAFAYMKDKPYTFSINLSEEDLNQNYLPRYIQQKLHHHDIDPQRVIFEILEGVSAGGKKTHIEQLKSFKKMGIKLAIDDFGAEYSNFERVVDLDIDFLKIDSKYIKDIDVHEKSYEIVKAIVYFSKNTGIPCIAEFVSNVEIQVVVERLGIDYSQGYLYSKPQSYIKSD
jgi:diguanylate cyclase (GGDEF)-like protein